MRNGVLAVAIIALTCCSGVAAAGAKATTKTGAAPPVKIEVDPGQQAPVLNLGDKRDDSQLTIRFLAEGQLPGKPTPSILPFQTTEGSVLAAKVKASTWLVQGGETVLVKVSFGDLGSAQAGSYTSSILLRGGGASAARAPLTVKLEPTPVSHANLWAVILLLAGALVGLIGRWVAGAAVKVHGLRDRLAVVEAQVSGLDALPAAYVAKLSALRIQLAQESTSGAEETLAEVEKLTPAAVQVADAVNSMNSAILAHEAQIAAMPDPTDDYKEKLQQVLTSEKEVVENVLREPEFDGADAAQARSGFLDGMRKVRVFLANFASPALRGKLEPALAFFMKAEFDEGDKKAGEVLDAPAPLTVDMPLMADAALEPPQVPAPEKDRSLRGWAIRNASTIAAGFTAVALVIVGLFSVYHPDSTFRTEAFMDAVSLFAWGLGSAAAGIGLAELTGKLTAGKTPQTS